MPASQALRRLASVARKEFRHISRDPAALFAALLVPVCELFLVGFAVEANVRNVRTVVLD